MAVVGARRVAQEFPDKFTVVIIPDSGRSYLSKIFNDEWMADNGFTTDRSPVRLPTSQEPKP